MSSIGNLERIVPYDNGYDRLHKMPLTSFGALKSSDRLRDLAPTLRSYQSQTGNMTVFPLETSSPNTDSNKNERIARIRAQYHELVDKEFTEGLSAQETAELSDLDRLIDEYEMSQLPVQQDYVAKLNERMDESIEEAEKVHERLDKILGWLEARQSQE